MYLGKAQLISIRACAFKSRSDRDVRLCASQVLIAEDQLRQPLVNAFGSRTWWPEVYTLLRSSLELDAHLGGQLLAPTWTAQYAFPLTLEARFVSHGCCTEASVRLGNKDPDVLRAAADILMQRMFMRLSLRPEVRPSYIHKLQPRLFPQRRHAYSTSPYDSWTHTSNAFPFERSNPPLQRSLFGCVLAHKDSHLVCCCSDPSLTLASAFRAVLILLL